MSLFYVKIRKNIDICNYLPIYYPAICRGRGTFSVPSQGRAGEGLLLTPHPPEYHTQKNITTTQGTTTNISRIFSSSTKITTIFTT